MLRIHNTLFRPLTLKQAAEHFPASLVIHKVVSGIALIGDEKRPDVAAYVDCQKIFGDITENFPIFSRFQRERSWTVRKRLTEKLERALHPERFETAT